MLFAIGLKIKKGARADAPAPWDMEKQKTDYVPCVTVTLPNASRAASSV